MSERYIGERKRTNSFALYFCIAFVVFLLCLVSYAFFTGSIYRTLNGYDDCGNVCGMENKGNSLAFCGANDKRNDKFQLWNITYVEHEGPKDLTTTTTTTTTTPLQTTGREGRLKNKIHRQHRVRDNADGNWTETIIHWKCVADCEMFPGYHAVGGRCFKGNKTESTQPPFMERLSHDFARTWYLILLCFLVAMVFSYIVLILFRYAIKYVVWGIYIGMIVLLAIASLVLLGFCFSKMGSKDEQEADAAKGMGIAGAILGIFAMIIACLLCCFKTRIRMVIQLFREASKAIADVPLITIEPLATFLSFVVTAFLFLYFELIFVSAGHLEVKYDEHGVFDKARYEMNAVILMAHVVNFIAIVWFVQFIMGCQHFIIASTIADWYFARSKDKLDSPISRGFSNLLNFHLGSICLGSLLMTAIKIARMIVNIIKEQVKESENVFARIAAECCDCLMGILEELMQYLVRNAYIIVAKDGTPLYASGKRAFHLLTGNLLEIVALNKVGDFVLYLARIFVVAITGFVAYEIIGKKDGLEMPWLPILLVVVFAFLIIHCFMTVFEMTLDTIFICFCEDCEENNGMDRPYFMSTKMMKVMREIKQQSGGNVDFGDQAEESGARPMIQKDPAQPVGWNV